MDARAAGVEVEHKDGGDTLASQVVTEVDRQAQELILQWLAPTFEAADLALLTEESADDGSRLAKDAFWCIDPIDGTLPFVRGTAGFAVSIGLVRHDGTPLVGVVLDPHAGVLYHAVKGQGAFIDRTPWLPPRDGDRFTLVIDSSFAGHPRSPALLEALSKTAPNFVTLEHGGAVLNAIRVVQHAPACYFKLPKPVDGGGSLWDFAASACILGELGAVATDYHGAPLDLNRADSTFMNHHGAMLASSAEVANWMRDLLG